MITNVAIKDYFEPNEPFYLQYDGANVTVYTGSDMPVPEPKPVIEITHAQIYMAFQNQGILAAVEAFINTPGNETHKIFFEKSPYFHSDNALILSAASALGMSEDQVYSIFEYATNLP